MAIPPYIEPDWPAPSRVKAFTTTRLGGVSSGTYESFNLGQHVGDDPAVVATNRQRLQLLLPEAESIQWLEQVHGVTVAAATGVGLPTADACWTRAPATVCTVMTADCLPVLFTDREGSVVAAAHAGWRGLLAGVLEATVAAMAVAPGEVIAWMGPAIGPAAFEVGPEVRDAFLAHSLASASCFAPNPTRTSYYFADLYQLARQRLAAISVTETYGGDLCTFDDPLRFYSYRRDGQTGRMASVIMLLE